MRHCGLARERESDMTTADLPEGFEPLFRTSPFLERTGPFYVKGRGAQLKIGLRVQEHHLNGRGHLHGGMVMTMADIALGYAMSTSAEPPIHAVTSSMSADFAGSARLGDWVESAVDIQKVGRTLAFANVYLSVGEQRIARASGVFAVTPGKT
jgi:uncharacterized protein (TIGR00369 family)